MTWLNYVYLSEVFMSLLNLYSEGDRRYSVSMYFCPKSI